MSDTTKYILIVFFLINISFSIASIIESRKRRKKLDKAIARLRRERGA